MVDDQQVHSVASHPIMLSSRLANSFTCSGGHSNLSCIQPSITRLNCGEIFGCLEDMAQREKFLFFPLFVARVSSSPRIYDWFEEALLPATAPTTTMVTSPPRAVKVPVSTVTDRRIPLGKTDKPSKAQGLTRMERSCFSAPTMFIRTCKRFLTAYR